MKVWKKIFHACRNQGKSVIAIAIPDKTDFKPKTVPRDKEDHCIIIKGSIYQEDKTIINLYLPMPEHLNILSKY